MIYASVRTALLLCLLIPAAVTSAAPPPAVIAASYQITDLQSGQVLADSAPDSRVEPGALVKLMTAYLIFDAWESGKSSPDTAYTLSDRGMRTDGTRMFLLPGKTETGKTLLAGMLAVSANDAAITLAEAMAGSESSFVARMNAEAQKLGMAGTRFTNCTGLPDANQYTTAADLSRLAQALMTRFPQYADLFAAPSFTYNGVRQNNRNLLLFRRGDIRGLAVGSTPAGGFNLAAEAVHGKRKILLILMGADSTDDRAIEGAKLIDWSLAAFDTVPYAGKGRVIADMPVHNGSRAAVPAGFADDAYITVPAGTSATLHTTFESVQPLLAPVKKGSVVGTLIFTGSNGIRIEKPVVALEAVDQAGGIRRWWPDFRAWLQSLFS